MAHPRTAEPGSKEGSLVFGGSSWGGRAAELSSPDPRALNAKLSMWTCPWGLKQTPRVASAGFCPTGVTPVGLPPNLLGGRKSLHLDPKINVSRVGTQGNCPNQLAGSVTLSKVSLPETLTVVQAGCVCTLHNCWRKALVDPSFTDEQK